MRRLSLAAAALATLIGLGAVAVFVGDSAAELENQVFTSRADRLRMVVPRGWRATDQPSYPGLLVWMMRTQPPGQIVLTAESYTHELYCSWSAACRAQPTNTARYSCALHEQLAKQKMRVGPSQLGPKENELAGLSSVWFEYDDGKRFLRQAVAVTDERAISLVLSAPTNEARATHVRAFDQALRSLQVLTVAEAAPIGSPDAAPVALVDAAGDGATDAMTLPADAATLDAGVMFSSTTVRREPPVGPCTQRQRNGK